MLSDRAFRCTNTEKSCRHIVRYYDDAESNCHGCGRLLRSMKYLERVAPYDQTTQCFQCWLKSPDNCTFEASGVFSERVETADRVEKVTYERMACPTCGHLGHSVELCRVPDPKGEAERRKRISDQDLRVAFIFLFICTPISLCFAVSAYRNQKTRSTRLMLAVSLAAVSLLVFIGLWNLWSYCKTDLFRRI